jgi:ABC-2 type transport system ATP-binding protein
MEAEGLEKSYGPIRALQGVTLKVPAGAVGLLGPNGAGKSTLIKALLGLVRVQKGKGRVLGFDIRSQPRLIRQRVGYMPEDDCFISGLPGVSFVAYCGELYGLPRRAALRRAHEILDYVGVGEERYRNVETYSTGMRQKVKLAQALVHDPQLVFLDEPTSGLDPQARSRMLRLIRELAEIRKISVVVSTHILPDVECACTAVVILGRGKVLMHDRLETLRRPVDASYLLRVHGEVETLARALQKAGCTCETAAVDALRVTGNGMDVADVVLREAKGLAVEVREIHPARNSLEAIFVRAVSGDGDARI